MALEEENNASIFLSNCLLHVRLKNYCVYSNVSSVTCAIYKKNGQLFFQTCNKERVAFTNFRSPSFRNFLRDGGHVNKE